MFTRAENSLGPRDKVACSSGQGMTGHFLEQRAPFLHHILLRGPEPEEAQLQTRLLKATNTPDSLPAVTRPQEAGTPHPRSSEKLPGECRTA